jgi:hypothetical protein
VRHAAPNPALSPWLRAFFVVVALVVIFGSGLLWLPDHIRPHWPWPITPFNAAFLGGVYLTELVAVLVIVAVNRWAPSRVTLPMSLAFTFVVSAVTLGYLDRLDYQKLATYAWFVTYFGAVAVTAALGRYRRLPPVDATPVPPGWRVLLWAQGTLLGLYALFLLVAPAAATRFWPWPIDAFHGRVYSAVFASGCVGAVLLTRAMAPVEAATYGLTQVCFGLFAIVGLVATDASRHRVAWGSVGTRAWLAGCALLFLAGAVLLARGAALAARAHPPAERTPTRPAPSA